MTDQQAAREGSRFVVCPAVPTEVAERTEGAVAADDDVGEIHRPVLVACLVQDRGRQRSQPAWLLPTKSDVGKAAEERHVGGAIASPLPALTFDPLPRRPERPADPRRDVSVDGGHVRREEIRENE